MSVFVPSPAASLLADLDRGLAELGLRWYVFGAQAVVLHGRPRLTEDVDVTVALGTVDPRDLVATLQDRGFRLAAVANQEFIAATRVLPFHHEPSGMELDLVLAGPGLEELFLSEATPMDVGGVVVPVIRVEHLIVTKILSGRAKDLDDAGEILHGRGAELDLATVRLLLGQLEEALGQSDLLPLLDSLLVGDQTC